MVRSGDPGVYFVQPMLPNNYMFPFFLVTPMFPKLVKTPPVIMWHHPDHALTKEAKKANDKSMKEAKKAAKKKKNNSKDVMDHKKKILKDRSYSVIALNLYNHEKPIFIVHPLYPGQKPWVLDYLPSKEDLQFTDLKKEKQCEVQTLKNKKNSNSYAWIEVVMSSAKKTIFSKRSFVEDKEPLLKC